VIEALGPMGRVAAMPKQRAKIMDRAAAGEDKDTLLAQRRQRPAQRVMPGCVAARLHRQLQHRHIGIGIERAHRNPSAVVDAALSLDADVPVLQLSVQPRRDAAWHDALGRSLAPLRDEGVLILASGGAVHNLGALSWEGGATPAWAQRFDDWLAASLAEGRRSELLDWKRKAPDARQAQPTDEHFLP